MQALLLGGDVFKLATVLVLAAGVVLVAWNIALWFK
jgi:hypothetical protein